jgi:antitoxin (DNA-binding transcriptional repressor) of toxin-antitoxin stability system
MTRTLSVTEAARGFADVINRIVYRGESAVLMRGGKPVAKIIPVPQTGKTGRELAALWPTLAHLSPEEAEVLAHEIESARASLPQPVNKWD